MWEQELKYASPTPVPEQYVPVPVHQKPDLDVGVFQKSDKPKHLHFYNPYCPCSKFNLPQFTSLVKKYSKKIDFYVVVPTEEDVETIAAAFGQEVTVVTDPDEKLAKACGVYATPQAVLIDDEGKLYYRGNYNKSRYCTAASSNYAQFAIDSLLAHKPAPHMGNLAITAYGCELSKKSWFSLNIDIP
ncbi:hypothetical protein D770_02220 [Flammeovirgaceae bacterium 311]|nr:hypothetical protein D770_02220 [Flammeovirgaceae bacterium 311]